MLLASPTFCTNSEGGWFAAYHDHHFGGVSQKLRWLQVHTLVEGIARLHQIVLPDRVLPRSCGMPQRYNEGTLT